MFLSKKPCPHRLEAIKIGENSHGVNLGRRMSDGMTGSLFVLCCFYGEIQSFFIIFDKTRYSNFLKYSFFCEVALYKKYTSVCVKCFFQKCLRGCFLKSNKKSTALPQLSLIPFHLFQMHCRTSLIRLW